MGRRPRASHRRPRPSNLAITAAGAGRKRACADEGSLPETYQGSGRRRSPPATGRPCDQWELHGLQLPSEPRRTTRLMPEATSADQEGRRTKPWGKSVRGTQRHLMVLLLGRTTVLKHLWVRAASGFWLGISVATPNIDCLARRWCSRSRRKPPSIFGRRVERQGLW
jgi:hypothetical protein